MKNFIRSRGVRCVAAIVAAVAVGAGLIGAMNLVEHMGRSEQAVEAEQPVETEKHGASIGGVFAEMEGEE